MNKELYQWQKTCLKHWFANNGRGIVQAVTGSGKTLLALTAAQQLEQRLSKALRVKIVVPTSALMWQWNRALREFIRSSEKISQTCGETPQPYTKTPQPYIETPQSYGETSRSNKDHYRKIGLRGDGCKSSPNCQYMIYVINSARYELARQILTELKQGESVLLIADECHHYISGQNQLIFEFLPYIKEYESHFFSLGLTATLPAGRTEKELCAVLGKKVFSYGMSEASASHTISKYDVFHIELAFRVDERAEYDELTEQLRLIYAKLLHRDPLLGDLDNKERFEQLKRLSGSKDPETARMAAAYMGLTFKRKNLVCLASARTLCVCRLVSLLADRWTPGERILIFGERICQADDLFLQLSVQYPGRVGRYHSKMGVQANKNALERFRSGELRILITCKSMDEGIDVPDASIGIILSGTSTQRQRVQRLGRIIRKQEGKSRALLYYLHLEDTSEETFFLPDHGETRSFDLKFCSEDQRFYDPAYENAAEKFIRSMWCRGLDHTQLQEARRCLQAGYVRSDWLLDRKEAEKRIREAKSVHEKNYWICMKNL